MGRGGRETKVFRGVFLWQGLAGVRETGAGKGRRWMALKAQGCGRGEKLRMRRTDGV